MRALVYFLFLVLLQQPKVKSYFCNQSFWHNHTNNTPILLSLQPSNELSAIALAFLKGEAIIYQPSTETYSTINYSPNSNEEVLFNQLVEGKKDLILFASKGGTLMAHNLTTSVTSNITLVDSVTSKPLNITFKGIYFGEGGRVFFL